VSRSSDNRDESYALRRALVLEILHTFGEFKNALNSACSVAASLELSTAISAKSTAAPLIIDDAIIDVGRPDGRTSLRPPLIECVSCVPTGIRSLLAAVNGRCRRPLDDVDPGNWWSPYSVNN
jgi:hypothetical protein